MRLVDVPFDKYGGRALACVLDGEGRDIAAALVTKSLARAYDGRRREPWCGKTR